MKHLFQAVFRSPKMGSQVHRLACPIADAFLTSRSRLLLIILLLCLLPGGCNRDDESIEKKQSQANSQANDTNTKNDTVYFEDVTVSSGIEFDHQVGEPKQYFFPDIMVAGCGVIDFDKDGLLDLLLVDSGRFGEETVSKAESGSTKRPNRHRLYRQTEPGKFKDVTTELGLNETGYGCGVAVADVNNDGYDDLYFTNFGDDTIWINQQGKSFRDATGESGIRNPSWGTSATFFDFDRDGRLDLYVANYVSYLSDINCANAAEAEDFCSPQVFKPTVDRLFRNVSEGDQVRFEDVTSEMGMLKRKGPGLGVISRDFNRDGFPDLYVANDGQANFLWINQEGRGFEESASQLGCAMSLQGEAQAGMGLAEADLDLNGVSDIVVTHLDGETNAAYLGSLMESDNGQQLFYTESGGAKGVQKISKPMTGFGIGLPDLDNDGDKDMLTVNGRVTRRKREPAKEFWNDYAERNQISLNRGEGKFDEFKSERDPFCLDVAVSRGLSVMDFDNDGKMDCLVSNTAGKARLYRNVFEKSGNWIGFALTDPGHGGRSSLGAVIKLKLANGSIRQQTIQTDGSYMSARDHRAHFGLGQQDTIDSVIIFWPDQSTEVFPIRKINQYHAIEKGTGKSGN